MFYNPKSLVFLFHFLTASVVELDIPYDDAQVPEYGPAFKAWTEDDIDAAFAAIKDACPWSQLAYVVLQFSYHSGRFIIRLLKESVQRLLAKDCRTIDDFFLIKTGT